MTIMTARIRIGLRRPLFFSIALALSSLPGLAQTCAVDWNSVDQRIDGFGACSAFSTGNITWTTAQADMFFSTNTGTGTAKSGSHFTFTGIGLSLLRNQIQPPANASGIAFANANEINLMQLAQTRGAKVWSAPWTPPNFCKDTNSPNGGNYLGSGGNLTNRLYARELAGYVATMKSTYGVNIYAISIQNEPENSTVYASCVWTPGQYHDFVTNLYPALVASNAASTLIMLPEDEHWETNYYTPAMDDPAVAADVGIIANHNYDPNGNAISTNTPVALNPYGKALWETEVSSTDAFDGSITNAVNWALRIHLFLTVAQANAWHYWWLIALGADNEGLTDDNYVPCKRMYALGQFSRFVRPNYYRMDAAGTGNVLISAYQNSSSSNFVIVAINTNTSTTVSQTFDLTNFPGAVSSVTPWITSATLSLSNQPPVVVSNAVFSYTLPALSVVTFVGQAVRPTNSPPVLTPVADQTIGAGQTLLVTNVVSDPDFPPQVLTFSLMSGPGAINATNGTYVWRPPVSFAKTTNPVTINVADNGTPSLSATGSFKVIVDPLILPSLGAISISGGQVTLLVDGPLGPDYTVLTATNLSGPTNLWQKWLTTNAPVPPLSLVDTNSSYPMRFYRIQIGP